jgi:SagB-type dehydrogenase family enzyme
MIQSPYSGRGKIATQFIYFFLLAFFPAVSSANMQPRSIQLNPPRFQEKDFQVLLEKRYSCRNFKNKSLKLDDLASILWAACGKRHDAVTAATRTIASAGATYPLELFLLVGDGCVDELLAGCYHYSIEGHSLEQVKSGDLRQRLAAAALSQSFISQAPVSLVIAADFTRTTSRYKARGEQYVYIEAGHAGQNIYLAAYGLGLATVEVGAFSEPQVSQALGLSENFTPLIIMPVGYP